MSWPVRAAVLALSSCALTALADGLPFEVSMEVLDSIDGADGVVLVLEPVDAGPGERPAAAGDRAAAVASVPEAPAAAAPAQESESQPE